MARASKSEADLKPVSDGVRNFKNFRTSQDLEQLYRLIHDNNLRAEAHMAVSSVVTGLKKMEKKKGRKKRGRKKKVLCLLYTSPSPRDATLSRMPSSA